MIARCSCRSASSRPTANSSVRARCATSTTPSRRTTCRTRRRCAPTWRRSRPARARWTMASAWCSTSSTRRGLMDNTLMIFTTDHGMPFPGAKATLSDRGLGVMLILRGPEPFNGGRVIDALVSHIDIYPTVCEYLGIERPPFLQGVSLLALLRGRGDERRARRSSPARPGTPPMSPSARSARVGTSTYAAGAIAARRCWRTPTTAPARICCCATAGPSARSPKSSCTTSCSTPTRRTTLSSDPAYAAVLGGPARAPGEMDARDRRSAAGRPRRSAAGR